MKLIMFCTAVTEQGSASFWSAACIAAGILLAGAAVFVILKRKK